MRLFQVASEIETTKNDRKKSDGYVFIPTIVDQKAKKTHPRGLESTAIPHFKIDQNTALSARD